VFEDTLVPLFEEYGKIYDLRIMMDSLTGMSRGYAFVTFMDAESCKKASEEVCCGFCEVNFGVEYSVSCLVLWDFDKYSK
jgi:hypothetical protein